MPNEPTADDVLALVRGLMHIPAVKQMVDLDMWGKENGLDSDKRAAVVSAISGLFASSASTDVAKEYVRRLLDVIVALGPALAGNV